MSYAQRLATASRSLNQAQASAADAPADVEKLNKVGRLPKRAAYDYETVHSIFRAAPFVTLGFVTPDGLPQVVPMIGALEQNSDGQLWCYLHGYGGARFIKLTDEPGTPVSVNATLIDGHVLAIAQFSHSTNYRSATLHGISEPIAADDLETKRRIATLVVESAVPGRSSQSRAPTDAELKTTGFLRIRVESGSAKIRTGSTGDSAADIKDDALLAKTWTGVVPLSYTAGQPEPAAHNVVDQLPDHVSALVARKY